MGDGNGDKTGHLPDGLMTAYLNGRCAPAEAERVEGHCVLCDACRAHLAILLRVDNLEVSREDRRQIEALLALTQEAVAGAREQPVGREEDPGSDERVWPVATGRRRKSAPLRRSSPGWPRQGRGLHLSLAWLAVAVIIAGAVGLWILFRPSPTAQALSALRRAFQHSRPLEARLTGGFDYHPFELRRGPADQTGIDQNQLNYALAELTLEVTSHPTPAARQGLGQLYLLRGEFDQAEEQLTLALKGWPGDARLHADLGALYYERGKQEEAVLLLSRAVEHHTEAIRLDPKLAEAWFNRALCYEQMALFTDARADWERYLQLDPDSRWANEARDHLQKLRARAAVSKADRQVPTEYLAAEAASDGGAMRRLVADHFVTIKEEVAEPLLDQYLARELAGESAQADESLMRLRRLGQLLNETGGDRFIADAVEFAAQGEPAVKREIAAVRARLRQADEDYEGGRFDAAAALYTAAREDAERLGDLCHAEAATLGLIHDYRFHDRRTDFPILGSRLIATAAGRSHRLLEARALVRLGNAYISSSQLSRALDLTLQGAKAAKEVGDIGTAVNGLRLAGGVYALMGEVGHALKKNFEALSLLREHRVAPLRAAQAYSRMGDTLFAQGEYLASLPFQQESARLAEQGGSALFQAGVQGQLGLTYGKLGRYEEAQRHLKAAAARAETVTDRTARTLLDTELSASLGDLYLQQGKLDAAVTIYQRLITALGDSAQVYYLPFIHQAVAAAYLKQSRWAEAEAELKTSIALAERDRATINEARSRSAFLVGRQDLYQAMTDFQFTQKQDPRQAFYYAELMKSREFLDALKGPSEVSGKGDHIEMALSGAVTPLTLEEVQHALPPGLQLVEYAVAEQRVMIWLITRDRVISHSSPVTADRLRRLTDDYLDELRRRGDAEHLNRRAEELYGLLISPISTALAQGGVVCIVADRAMQQLPFSALVSPVTGRHLVEDYELAIDPSASVLVRALELSRTKASEVPEKYLGLSNPRLRHRPIPLPALAATEQEVARAQGFYPRHLVLNREEATESALTREMGDYEIVHLATHILPNGRLPLLSSIPLADEPDGATPGPAAGHPFGPDGSLQAYEVARLKLRRTRLVILSGCRSGSGDDARWEALGGLAQAFFVARVPTVMASLWDVEDESTAALMAAFHEQHRLRGLGFSAALRQAQISLIRAPSPARRHPYYWAAFIVTGDGLGGQASPPSDPHAQSNR